MSKVKVKLRDLSLRGETTHTRWGHVSFDRDGLSSLEVDEADLQMLRDIRWLVEEPALAEPEPLPGPPEASPARTFDSSDVTPPQGLKKRRS